MSQEIDPEIRQAFLDAMSHTASTVNVVTTDGPGGRMGVTVSAMSSVSADTTRPSLLVCVHHMSPSARAIVENGVFCVNVLRDDQSYISDTFAGRFKTEDGDKFSCAEWTTQVTGAPRVVDPLVAFDCRVASGERVGTHHVFIGEVQDIFTAEGGSPLIFAHRAYGSPTRIRAAANVRDGAAAEAARLRVGCFHTFGPYVVPEMVSRMAETSPQADVRIVEGDQKSLSAGLMSGEIEYALLYDMGLGADLETERLASLEPYVLLAEDHRLTGRSELRPEDLLDDPMILLDSPPSRDYFLSIFEKSGREPRLGHSSSSFEVVRGLVGHGLGYSVLATRPASPLTYDGRKLVARPLVSDIEPSHVVLAGRTGRRHSPLALEFARHCREYFSNQSELVRN